MRSSRHILMAMVIACVGATVGTTPSSAQGFGSFALCYERLKQLVALLDAQGANVEETVDEPREKRYVVVTVFGEKQRTMSCSPKGDLLVEDE